MPPRGLLTVIGTIDINQFWPASKGTASSDGDTIHLKVDPATSFLHTSPSGANPKRTTAYVGAYVLDHGKKKAVITSKSEIKIRLQGIDAPELHYPVIAKFHPSKKGKFKNEFRQPYGAGATNALHEYLKAQVGSATTIHAVFVTHIDKAQEAVDSHGRFVGDIIVGTGNAKSINTWLVENGWAVPLFYDSMTPAEVKTLVAAWKAGRKLANRAGRSLEKALEPFDPQRNVDNAKLPDGGKFNFPKTFRRQATFWTEVAGPLTAQEFVKKLGQGLTGKPDRAYELDYFLKSIDHLDKKKRVAFSSKIGKAGQALFDPQDLVFQEDPSTLFHANGKPVTAW
jgi:endonuclease YncB( thermonuclease family)